MEPPEPHPQEAHAQESRLVLPARTSQTQPVIRRPGIAVLLMLSAVATVLMAYRPPAPKPAAPHRFESKIADFEAQDRTHAAPQKPILFVGSSSIEKWPDLELAFPDRRVLNRGISSFKLEDLLHFFDRLIVPYHPGVVVLYGGDNDLDAGLSVEATLSLYREFLGRVDRVFPGTPVVLLAVKASPKRIQQLGLQMDLNRRLVELAGSRPRTEYVDTFTPLVDAAGRPDPRWFLADELHPNAGAYSVWNECLRPILARLQETSVPKGP